MIGGRRGNTPSIADLVFKLEEAGEVLDKNNVPCEVMSLVMSKENAHRLAEYIRQEQGKEPCPDCVSREAAVKMVNKIVVTNDELGIIRNYYHKVVAGLSKLPSVQPTPLTEVLESIKGEIHRESLICNNVDMAKAINVTEKIVNKHISGKEQK